MHKLIVLFTIVAFISISCGSDETSDPFIHYDGPNSTSPLLPAGDQQMAVYFPAGELMDAEGSNIKNIRLYVYNPPEELRIIVSEGSSGTQPGTELYNQPFIGLVRENTWNIHTMDPAFEITGEPLWITIEFKNAQTQQTVGCDNGPANPNGGDWLNQSTDNEWKTFRERTGESVNWNIRLELDQE